MLDIIVAFSLAVKNYPEPVMDEGNQKLKRVFQLVAHPHSPGDLILCELRSNREEPIEHFAFTIKLRELSEIQRAETEHVEPQREQPAQGLMPVTV